MDYKSEAEMQKLDAQMTKGPNKEILDHERKRKVELKCMEMQELMEEQGWVILGCSIHVLMMSSEPRHLNWMS